MVDDREAQRLLADAEDVGHRDRGEAEHGPPASIGLKWSATGTRRASCPRLEDRPHVENGDEGAADADEDEPEELGRGDDVRGFHPEQGRAARRPRWRRRAPWPRRP